VPGFLSEYDEVTRVTFGDRWHVDVRRFLARADFKAASAILISPTMSSDGDVATTTGQMDSGGYQDELVVRAIVGWNLTDRADQPLPLGVGSGEAGFPDATRRASVAVLPQKVFDYILLKIDGVSVAKTNDGKAAEEEAAKKKADEFPGGVVGGPVRTEVQPEAAA